MGALPGLVTNSTLATASQPGSCTRQMEHPTKAGVQRGRVVGGKRKGSHAPKGSSKSCKADQSPQTTPQPCGLLTNTRQAQVGRSQWHTWANANPTAVICVGPQLRLVCCVLHPNCANSPCNNVQTTVQSGSRCYATAESPLNLAANACA